MCPRLTSSSSSQGQLGGGCPTPKTQFHVELRTENGVRGTYATKEMRKGDVIAKIPLKAAFWCVGCALPHALLTCARRCLSAPFAPDKQGIARRHNGPLAAGSCPDPTSRSLGGGGRPTSRANALSPPGSGPPLMTRSST